MPFYEIIVCYKLTDSAYDKTNVRSRIGQRQVVCFEHEKIAVRSRKNTKCKDRNKHPIRLFRSIPNKNYNDILKRCPTSERCRSKVESHVGKKFGIFLRHHRLKKTTEGC